MSARTDRLAAPALASTVVPAATIVGGLALLLARVVVPLALLTPTLLAVSYTALLAVSLAGSAGGTGRRVAPVVAASTGGVAVVAARLLAGPAIGAEATATAVGIGAFAAVAEEAFFRRFLYARLEPAGPLVAVAVSAFLFAVIHVPAYGWGAFPVDLAAGLLLSWQRWASGSWGASASTHVLANLLAVIR